MLKVEGLFAGYGGRDVLHGIDLQLAEGRIACLAGPSGCGKSTLLRCIAGFEAPSKGLVSLAGAVVSGHQVFVPPEKRRIGIVFQDYALFPHLSVQGNIAFGIRAASKSQTAAQVKELLEIVDLGAFEHRYPHELSGGQQQRVALARALALKPNLLLLDEPFSNLDPDLAKRMQAELKKLLRTVGVTVVMVTHDPHEAFDVADVLGVMDQGRILQWGEPRDLYRRPCETRVAEFLGEVSYLPVVADSTGRVSCELGSLPPGLTAATGERLIIRPDDVVLVTGGPADASGHICEAQFRGTQVVYKIRLASGASIGVATSSREAQLPVGASVGLRLDLREARTVRG